MAFYDRSTEDQYEALATRQCRYCGLNSRHVQHGTCPRCAGEPWEDEVRARVVKTCEAARAAQRKRHPEWFR